MVSQSYIAACSNNCITPYATHAQEKLNLEVYYKRKIVEICEKIRRTNRYRTEEQAAYEDRIKKLENRLNDDFQGYIEELQKQVEDKDVKMEEQKQVAATLHGRVMELEKKLAKHNLCIRLAEAQFSNGVLITQIKELEKEAREHDQEKQNLEAYYKCVIDELIEKIRRTNRYRMEEQAAYEDRIKKLKKRLNDAKGSNTEEESATPGKDKISVNT